MGFFDWMGDLGRDLGIVNKVNKVTGAKDQADAQTALQNMMYATPPPPIDPSDEAIKNARIFERRRQLGLQGRMSTFLTTAQEESPAPPPVADGLKLGTAGSLGPNPVGPIPTVMPGRGYRP
jgi:hypothetical protein